MGATRSGVPPGDPEEAKVEQVVASALTSVFGLTKAPR